ncbi:gp21.5 [Bacillus phage SPO1]|uniref:Gp21.5 n=1 Tax=Bacillus phage SP01 TaxID=2884427 RepID=B6V2S4_BPSP1|nr:gp21.5 [Bacillus phage SPO1]ACI91016.1 gp21.5 [Bacillus phage SPO1]
MSDFKIKAMVEHGGSIWTLNQLFQKVSGYSDHYVTDKRTNRR